jgi:hypothetical protein
MKLAFTGSQRGMTARQFEAFMEFMKDPRWTEFGNGLCIGADAEAVRHVAFGRPDIKITGFPSNVPHKLAWGVTRLCYRVHPPKPPLDRNVDIAEWCDEMVATPKEEEEVIRSGTWTTIRRARERNKPVHILEP